MTSNICEYKVAGTKKQYVAIDEAVHHLGLGCPSLQPWGGMGLPSLGLGHRGTFRLFLFPVFNSSGRIDSCRLRHSGSPERDSSPPGSFPTERSGSKQEYRAWVKRSRSINSVPLSASLIEDGYLVRVPGGTSVPMMCRMMKQKQHLRCLS